ncbi:MAG: carbohydrate ABC transporter permease [Thermomicrobiales bacterium]|nr:carbohydrate ABC transporter permease [Thermomicrobiales bacterium]
MQPNASASNAGKRALVYLVLALALIWTLFPIYWVVVTSLKSNAELAASTPSLLPLQPVLDGYRTVIERGIPRMALNSVIVAVGTTIVSLALAVPGSYGLTRLGLPRRIGTPLALAIGFALIFPAIAIVVPMFQLAVRLGIYDQLGTLILLNVPFNAAFALWVLRTVWMDIPRNIEEAALLDGDTRFTAFRRVLLPAMLPSLIAVAVLVFIFTWNEFLFALIFSTSPRAMTLPIGIAAQVPQHELSWQIVAAAGTVALVPVVAATVLLQRYLVRGLTFGMAK